MQIQSKVSICDNFIGNAKHQYHIYYWQILEIF